jgi:hypothetical protein
MSSLKEVSVEIRGYPYHFFRRVEQCDIPWRNKDYLPFVVTFTPENNPEVLFNQSDEMLEKLKNEYPQEIFAAGAIYVHHPDKKYHEINLRTKPDSTPVERKNWAETVVGRINSAALSDRVGITINQKEFYVYNRPLDLYLKNPKPEIFQVFPNA